LTHFFIFIYLFISYIFCFENPIISILININNSTNYLEQCFDNLIKQSLKKIEIILINEESKEYNMKILKKYLLNNKIIILNKLNSQSEYDFLNFVNGKYFGIIKLKDFIDNNIFENIYEFSENKDIDIVSYNYYLFWEKKKKKDKLKNLKFIFNQFFKSKIFSSDLLILPSIWTGIYKKNFFFKNKLKNLLILNTISNKTYFFNKLFCNIEFLINNNISINSFYDKKIIKFLFNHKEFYEIEKIFKNNKIKNEKYYNTYKILVLLWNLNRIDKKKEFIQFLFKEIYIILKTDNYFHNKFSESEKRFLYNLKNYGEKITTEIYLSIYIKNNPKISIIIPIFNSEEFINECLNSLIKQTFKNFEVICINDGSNDNSLTILKEFEKKDERIHIFSQNNTGAGIARNVGMEKSKGEYLLFLDSDDTFEDIMLEELYAKIKQNDNEIVICNSQNFIVKENKKIFHRKNYLISDKILKIKSFSSKDIKKDFFNLFIWWPWDKLFKKKYIDNLGIKFQNLRSTNDLYFIASAVIAAKKISFLDKILVKHRTGINTSIENTREKSWDNFYYALKKLKHFIQEKNLYIRFHQDFINYVVSFSLWQLNTLKGNSFYSLYQNLKNKWLKEFDVTKYEKSFFYNNKNYKRINYILQSDLVYNNRKKIKYSLIEKIKKIFLL
jgi:glycosyltransferase involved in cell wall biosynthesis